MDVRDKRSALTLIELIIVIVIMGFIVPALLIALGDVTMKVSRAEHPSAAVILGRGLLEEIISKRFDENVSCTQYPCTAPCSCWSSTLGPDTSTTGLDGTFIENTADHENWDDVDDYDGFSESGIPGFPGFTREATVYYIDPSVDLDTAQPDSAQTNYKRVDVRVYSDRIGSVWFSFIITDEY